jgi:hypothetical protein
LLADFNNVAELSLQEGRASEEMKLLINAHKRMVAMMAQVALENRKVSFWMLWLTVGIFIAGVAVAALTAVLLYKP